MLKLGATPNQRMHLCMGPPLHPRRGGVVENNAWAVSPGLVNTESLPDTGNNNYPQGDTLYGVSSFLPLSASATRKNHTENLPQPTLQILEVGAEVVYAAQ